MESLLFDPELGAVVRAPLGEGEGWWAGAPGAYYDEQTDRFYLCYRYRRPRGVPPDRGGELRIAESEDGLEFRDLWTLTKDQLDSASIEKACLRRLPDGDWGLYLSYVNPADSRWCIDLACCPGLAGPGDLDVAGRVPVFRAPDLGLEAIKDPWIMEAGPCLWMIASIAEASRDYSAEETTEMHSSADAYDTGMILAHTGLASSVDGRSWRWHGTVLAADSPGERWDGYSTRISSVIRTGALFTAYYDGAIGVENHYDEQTCLAVSSDLRRWSKVADAPLLTSPHGTGCLRYVNIVEARAQRFVYYEYARPDGSHELRVLRL